MIAKNAGRCAWWGVDYPAGTGIVKGEFSWEVADPEKFDVDTSEAPFDSEERYFCTASCRAATDEEAARFLAEESEKQAATKHDDDFLRLLKQQVGEYIQGEIAKPAG